MTNNHFTQQTTTEVAQACYEESLQPRDEEQGYCLELFRRAFDAQDEKAWEAIQQQYQHLIRQWLYAQKQMLTVEQVEDLTQDAFHSFWKTLSKSSESFVIRFPHVGAVLNYMRQCAKSAVLLEQRQQKKRDLVQEKLISLVKDKGLSQVAVWEQASETQAQLERVQTYVGRNVSDPQEQRLLHLAYKLGLKPREIVERYPQDFSSVKEVNRVRERLIKRMRRALA